MLISIVAGFYLNLNSSSARIINLPSIGKYFIQLFLLMLAGVPTGRGTKLVFLSLLFQVASFFFTSSDRNVFKGIPKNVKDGVI